MRPQQPNILGPTILVDESSPKRNAGYARNSNQGSSLASSEIKANGLVVMNKDQVDEFNRNSSHNFNDN